MPSSSDITQYAAAPTLITLRNQQGMEITLMDWGATWLSCRVPLAGGELREVLLGCAQPEQYREQQAYLGAMIGRYANRIAGAFLPSPAGGHPLLANQGAHQLHGGPLGFDKRRWQVVEQTDTEVCLSLHSADGEQGYPGNLAVTVHYKLTPDNGVEILMQASTDRPTPVNLTNHAYFNLDGKPGDVRGHRLQLMGDQMLPTDPQGIPTGTLQSVAASQFDFRLARPLAADLGADEQLQQAKGYDHAFLLQPAADWAAQLSSTKGDLTLTLSTSLPSLQLYTGNYLGGTPARDGGSYCDYSGVALEPQFLPDTPHHPEWPQPSCWLLPGQHYRHTIHYQFSE